jgi:hypothetical protein
VKKSIALSREAEHAESTKRRKEGLDMGTRGDLRIEKKSPSVMATRGGGDGGASGIA